jgi:hypothetical protein
MRGKPNNTVILNNLGYVETRYVGDQSVASVQQVLATTDELVEHLRSIKEPALLLTDFSDLGKNTPALRQMVINWTRRADYDYIAVYGASVFIKHLTRLVVMALGKDKLIRYFNTREEAVSWLASRPLASYLKK